MYRNESTEPRPAPAARRLPALATAVFALSFAHAGENLAKCQSSGERQTRDCGQFVAEAKANAQAINAGGSQISNNSSNQGSNMPTDGGLTSSAITSQTQNLADLIGKCQKTKDLCDKQCKDALAAERAKPPGQQTDLQTIPSAQKDKCDDPIQRMIDQAQGEKDSLEGKAKQADDSKGNSGMPSMPSPSSSSPSDTASPASSPSSTSSCSGSTCDAPATATTPTVSTGAGGLLGDKGAQGSGETTSSTAYKDSPASPGGLAASGASTGSNSYGASGAASAAGSTGAVQPASVSPGATTQRESSGASIGSLSTEGGGGGGGGGALGGAGTESQGGGDPAELKRLADKFGGKPGGPAPASVSPTLPGASDVVRTGLGLFKISDAAIAAYCTRKYLANSCAK